MQGFSISTVVHGDGNPEPYVGMGLIRCTQNRNQAGRLRPLTVNRSPKPHGPGFRYLGFGFKGLRFRGSGVRFRALWCKLAGLRGIELWERNTAFCIWVYMKT